MFPSQRVTANIAPIGKTDVVYLYIYRILMLIFYVIDKTDLDCLSFGTHISKVIPFSTSITWQKTQLVLLIAKARHINSNW